MDKVKKVKVVIIPNPYKHDTRKVFYEEAGQEIGKCIIVSNLDHYLIYLNGTKTNQYSYILKETDVLIVIPDKGYNLKVNIENKSKCNIPSKDYGFIEDIANEQVVVFLFDHLHYAAPLKQKNLKDGLKHLMSIKIFEFIMVGKVQYALEGIYNFEDGLRCMLDNDLYSLYSEYLILNGGRTPSQYKNLEICLIRENIDKVESLYTYFKDLDILEQQKIINNTLKLVIENVEKDLDIVIKMINKEYQSLFEIFESEKNETLNILRDIQYKLQNVCSYCETDNKRFKELILDVFSQETVYNGRLISLYHVLYYATMYYFQNLILIENKDKLKKVLKVVNYNLEKKEHLPNDFINQIENHKLKLDELNIIQNRSLKKSQLKYFYIDYFRQTFKNKDTELKALFRRLDLISPTHYDKANNIINKTKIMFPESRLLSPKILY